MSNTPTDINVGQGAGNEKSIVLYKADGKSVPVEVHYMNETFWLTQEEIASLFDVDRTVVNKHLRNIVSEGELDLESICAKIAHMGSTGQMYQKGYYNLDAIIAVGYRVSSLKATRFRQWATTTLKEYIKKGFVLDDERFWQEGILCAQTVLALENSPLDCFRRCGTARRAYPLASAPRFSLLTTAGLVGDAA